MLMLLFFGVACDNGFWVVVLICVASVFAPGFPVALGFLYFRGGFGIFLLFPFGSSR